MMGNIVDLEACTDNKEKYVNIAEHIVETISEDRYVLEDRIREDFLKLSRMMCKCTEGERKKKWCEVEEIFGMEKEEPTREGYIMESFEDEPEKPGGLTYRGGYVQRSPRRE